LKKLFDYFLLSKGTIVRICDSEKLKNLYVNKIDGTNEHFANSIEVFLPNLKKLSDEIFEDLDVNNYGIGWWKDYSHLDLKRRILISDQLLLCTTTIQAAVIEAKLHYLELLGCWENEEKSLRHCAQLPGGRKKVNFPIKKSASDELDSFLADLHLKGLFSSLYSAFDCLAATYVGVFGLRFDILKVGYNSFKLHLINSKQYEGNEIQSKLFSQLKEIERRAGPENWLIWMFDYRNMSLHRGRRLTVGQLTPKPTGIHFMGTPLHETEAIKLLIRNPGVSEIESWKDGTFEPMQEDAKTTLSELFKSTIYLIESSSELLLVNWKSRKLNTRLILQPHEQWPVIRGGSNNLFKGFTSKKSNFTKSPRIVSNFIIKRLKAAGLDGDDIHLWKNEN
jgi:hypothetical protein